MHPRSEPVLQPVEVLPHAGTAQIIEDDDVPAFRKKARGEVRTDEAAASDDDDGAAHVASPRHVTNPRASSCFRISAALSVATAVRTQSTISGRDSISSCRGSKPSSR